MPITINLKQLEYTDGDNLKLDKVNYNFDQLVANGGGPQGTTGDQGATGYQGSTGYQGFQGEKGDQGFQGDQGSAGATRWVRINGAAGNFTADTLLPANDNTINPNAPVVVIGHVSGDANYAAEQAINPASGQIPSQFIVNRKSYFKSNMSLTSDDVANNSYDFKLESIADSLGNITTTLSQGFSLVNSQGNIKAFADTHDFYSNQTGTSLLNVSDDGTLITVETKAEGDVYIKKDLFIETTYSGVGKPDTDKIATSADSSGKVAFKTISELGGGIPVGTIVGILPSIFSDDSYFIQDQLSLSVPVNSFINFTIGSGIGDYSGWYLCNGQTWTDGTDQFQVPDLNTYNYVIQDNTDTTSSTSQGGKIKTDAKKTIIGGAEIEMTATYTGSNTYNISAVKDFTEDIIKGEPGGGTDYTVKKLPQIIYLGKSGLYFQIPGTPSPTYTNTYTFNFVENTTYPGISYQPGQSFTVNAPFGALPAPQTQQLNLQSPTGYRFTGSGYDLDWTLPTGVTIQSGPTYGGVGNATDGWSEVQYVFAVSQQLQNQANPIYISFEADMSGALTVLNQVAQTYIYNTGGGLGLNWTFDAASQTKTGIIGDSVALDPVTLTAVTGKYFDDTPSNPPTVPFAFYGTGTSRNDFTVTSHSYGAYNANGKAKELTLYITDNDFANANEVPGGISSSAATTLSFSAATYSMYPTLSPSGPSGQLLGSTGPTSRTYTVTNQTGSPIYVAAYIRNETNNSILATLSDIVVSWNGNQKAMSGNENTVLHGVTPLTTINHGASVTSLMSVLSLTGDQTWFARLMWTSDPTPSENPWAAGQTTWNVFL